MRVIELEPKCEDGFAETDMLQNAAKWVDPQHGIQFKDMELAFKLADQIEAVKDGRLYMEEADWKLLCDKFDKVQWLVPEKRLVALGRKLHSAGQISAKQIEEAAKASTAPIEVSAAAATTGE